MKVLTFTSQKGGSGKTTLSGHIAVQAELSGAGPVAVVDADPQGNLTDWWNERRSDRPAFVRTTIAQLERDIDRLREQGVKLLVIDTPPAITDTIATVITLSDLVVIPTRPSPHDLRAAGLTIDLVERAGKPMVFVINAAQPGARITVEAAVALSQHGTVAPMIVHQRTQFAVSMIDGRTVMELRRAERARDEIAELWTYLSKRVFGGDRATVLPESFSALGGRADATAQIG